MTIAPRSSPQSKRHVRVSAAYLVALLGVVFSLSVEARPAADWSLDNPAGITTDFHTDAAGKPAVMLFWATWCPYCKRLLPHLETLRAEFEARGVRFYAINIWEDGDPVQYFKDKEIGMALLLDADDVARAYAVKGTPSVIVTDAAFEIVYERKRGASEQDVEDALRNTLNTLLDAP